MMFARLLLAVAVSTSAALFSSSEPVRFTLAAPFDELFEHGRTDDTYTVTGTLTMAGSSRPSTIEDVTIGLRGNTSRRESECSFPKLKITLPQAASTEIPIFAGMKSIKIGTHCGEAENGQLTARFGRLANQQSPRREAFIYSLLAAVGVPALRARPAVITYVYANGADTRERSIERQAIVLEDADDAIKRVGGRGDITEQEFTTAQALFTPADTLAVAFGEALIGNFDWCLKMTARDNYRCDRRHPVWNIAVADLGSGKARPLLHDFDVSGMVTGRHPWFASVFNESFVPSHSQIDTEVLAQVQRTRTLFPRAGSGSSTRRIRRAQERSGSRPRCRGARSRRPSNCARVYRGVLQGD